LKKTRVCKIAALAITTSILIIIGIGLGMVYRGEVRLPSIPLSLVGLDVSADKVSYMHADGNGRRWVLEADTAQYHRDSRKALLNQVRVTFYQHDEKVLYLTANNGELQADNKIITVQGNVVARSAPDTILRTHSLVYQGAMGLVSTADPVDIETTRMHVKGIGMTMDLNSNQIEIHQSVQSWMMGT
jgi:LPS export ABC transporter protein LptC